MTGEVSLENPMGFTFAQATVEVANPALAEE